MHLERKEGLQISERSPPLFSSSESRISLKSLHLKSLISLLNSQIPYLSHLFLSSVFSHPKPPHSQIFSDLVLTLASKLALLDLFHLISSILPQLGLYLILILGLGYGFFVNGVIFELIFLWILGFHCFNRFWWWWLF